MGIAAYNRASSVIRSRINEDYEDARKHEELRLMIEIAEACNDFSRQAQDYIIEPKGLRSNTIELAKSRRGWKKRHEALIKAHCEWVNVDYRNASAYHHACVAKAKASYQLFIFALGTWTIPGHIKVPRAAK